VISHRRLRLGNKILLLGQPPQGMCKLGFVQFDLFVATRKRAHGDTLPRRYRLFESRTGVARPGIAAPQRKNVVFAYYGVWIGQEDVDGIVSQIR
jgi:hypothetical protein